MNATPEVCKSSAWAGLRTASKAQLNGLRHYFDRRHMEGGLAALIEAARGHKAQGRPPGSPVYAVLHREALLLVEAYSKRWGAHLEQLYAEIPGFNMLRELAQPNHGPDRWLQQSWSSSLSSVLHLHSDWSAPSYVPATQRLEVHDDISNLDR
jgi:hypothetical protein